MIHLSHLIIRQVVKRLTVPDFTIPPPSHRIIPTIVQFGASSPLEFSRASTLIASHVQGIDLNCGCPQSWACAECLGAALMNQRELVADMVKEAKTALERDGWKGQKTVSVKIRVHKDLRYVDLKLWGQRIWSTLVNTLFKDKPWTSSKPFKMRE